jgi:hypothetical protein
LIAIDEALPAKQEQKQADARKQSKVRLKPFRETVQDYVAEHLAVALLNGCDGRIWKIRWSAVQPLSIKRKCLIKEPT